MPLVGLSDECIFMPLSFIFLVHVVETLLFIDRFFTSFAADGRSTAVLSQPRRDKSRTLFRSIR
jgi:hypothetical protein